MSLYVDSSALLKRYLSEDDSARFEEILLADPDLVSARHTYVEARRAISQNVLAADLTAAREQFRSDWSVIRVVELDEATCELAAEFAETTGARTLDALHLAAAHRVGGGALSFVTADLRLAQIARSLGWMVLGA